MVTDHNVKNLFDITDRSYVLGEQTVIAEGTSRILKSTKLLNNTLVPIFIKIDAQNFDLSVKKELVVLIKL